MNVTITIDDQKLRVLQDVLKIALQEWQTMQGFKNPNGDSEKVSDYAFRIYSARDALGLSTNPSHFVIGYTPPEWETISCT